MSIHKIFGIFNQIATQGAKTVKEQILRNNEGDMEFREALTFLLNPYIVTGISTKKMKKKVKDFELKFNNHDLNTLSDLIEYLKVNNSGRDYDVFVIQRFANKHDEDINQFIRKLATKDLKLGISEKTVNKVYGEGTIPSFAVMLAESFEKKHAKVTGKFYVTLKLDGNRCVAMNGEDGVKFFTRKGQAIEGMSELEAQVQHLPKGWVFDGELLLDNPDNLPSDELFRATQKVVRKDGEKKGLNFHIFDGLPIAEFKKGKSKLKYEQRRNTLEVMFSNVEVDEKLLINTANVFLLNVIYEGDDKSVIPVLMKEVEAQGFEGLMVNTANGLYQSKRVNDLLKVKTMKTADLLVMSVERAIDGQFEGLLGRVNVEYKGNLVGVGSGFTLEQRREFIENPDAICGKIIEVQYFEESKDEKTGQPSLRFPVFKGIRHDKDVEDINYGE